MADDVAGIIRALNVAPASVYGCSSGGQVVLSLGKYHLELIRNIMAHEAALQADAPIENAGFISFKNSATLKPLYKDPSMSSAWQVGNCQGMMALDQACKDRIKANKAFWQKYYVGSVDMDSYTGEDFQRMPPTAFTVGIWTSAWLVYANIETAKRGRCPLTWLHSGHHPECSCPKDLAAYIRKTVKQYV